MKRRFLLPIFFFIVLSLFSTLSTAQAALPTFQSYDIGNNLPFVDESVDITLYLNFIVGEEDITPYVGTLSLQLFWSRDQVIYHGVTMSLISSTTYRGTIPAQDGSDNQFYNEGGGECYWYIKISNNAGEESTLYDSTNPNDVEIFFVDPDLDTTVILGEEIDTYVPPNPIAEVFENLPPILINGVNITRDPVFQTIILLIIGVVVALIVFSVRSERVIKSVFGFFQR